MTHNPDPTRHHHRWTWVDRIIAIVIVLSILAIADYTRHIGLWGATNAMIQMRHDPLGDENLLGYTRCKVIEKPGELIDIIDTTQSRVVWYAPGTEPNEQTLQQTVNYALDHGWTETGWKDEAWKGTKPQILHTYALVRTTIRIDPHPKIGDDNCWLVISMGVW